MDTLVCEKCGVPMALAEKSCLACGHPAPEGRAAQILKSRAEAAYELGDLEAACRQMAKAIESGLPGKELPLAWRKLGVWQEKRYTADPRPEFLSSAENSYLKAFTLDDSDDLAHQLYIACLGRQGQTLRAVALYQQRLGKNPQDAMAQKQLDAIKLAGDIKAKPVSVAAKSSKESGSLIERWLKPNKWKVTTLVSSLVFLFIQLFTRTDSHDVSLLTAGEGIPPSVLGVGSIFNDPWVVGMQIVLIILILAFMVPEPLMAVNSQSVLLREKALLLGYRLQGAAKSADESMQELKRLAESAGAEVVGTQQQQRRAPDPATYFGEGKVAEIKQIALELNCSLLVVDDELKPSQQRNLEAALDLKIIDRTQLILDIFAQRAQTSEGKLQVELAQLNYLLPRLVGMGKVLSRLGGGIGARGPGETKLETDRRRLRDRIAQLGAEMDLVARTRGLHREHRKKNRAYGVALAGYTNAGKSSLFNALTEGNAFVEDRLFATLDPAVRPLKTAKAPVLPLLLSDTVGFIRKLPHSLIAAFRATLEEIADADLIVRVLDASSPHYEAHLATVDEVLEEILLSQKSPALKDRQTMLVFNKCDLLSAPEFKALKACWPRAFFVSAETGENLEALAEEFQARSQKGLKKQTFFLPPDKANLLARHYDALAVLSQEWGPKGLRVEALLKSPVAELEAFKVVKK